MDDLSTVLVEGSDHRAKTHPWINIRTRTDLRDEAANGLKPVMGHVLLEVGG